MRTDEHRHTRNGLAVVERTGTGPPIVLVHGAMDRSTSFGRAARHLTDRALVRYDRRGYGASGPGTAVGLDAHVDDLLAVIDGREVVVFGHSVGGTIALAAAARPGTTIRALGVYESPVPSVAGVTPFRYDPATPPADVAEQFLRRMIGDRLWSRLPARTREDRRTEGPALIADFEIVRDEASALDVGRVTVPVVVGVGDASAPEQTTRARELVAALPDAVLRVVVGGDHGVHLSNPGATADLVREVVSAGTRSTK